MIPVADAILACALALNVPKSTINNIIQVESGGNPLALNINGSPDRPRASSIEEAAAIARRYIAAGHSVDLGLTQLNSRNLAGLGLTIEQALDPCTNVGAGATILNTFYAISYREQGGNKDAALQVALSRYNTGFPVRGFLNGYVAKYFAAPALAPNRQPAPAPIQTATRAPSLLDPYSAQTSVYSREGLNINVE